jgi:hypothetical protein
MRWRGQNQRGPVLLSDCVADLVFGREDSDTGEKGQQLSEDARFNQDSPEEHAADPERQRPHPGAKLDICNGATQEEDARA